MRPKKRIIVWTANEMTRSVLRIVLDARGYKACVVTTEEEIWEQAKTAHVCVLAGLQPGDSDGIERRLYREFHGCVAVIAGARGAKPEAEWIAGLLEKVHLATVRKRGPAKGSILHARSREAAANAQASMDKRSGKAVAA